MKRIAQIVSDDFHTTVKIRATQEKKSMNDYVLDLIKADLEKDIKKETTPNVLPD